MYYLEFTNLPLEYLHEVYFGKSKTLLEMENQIGVIREEYKNLKDMTAHPATQAFNRLMEKQFGMEIFALQIIPSPEINAYTIPIAKRFDVVIEDNIKELVEMDKKTGYRFKKDNGLCIMAVIYSSLLTNQKFTNAEILAIILHEVGHNFADAIHDKLRLYNINMMEAYMNYWLLVMIFDPKHIPTYIKFNITNKNEYQKEKEENRKPNPVKTFLQYTINNIDDFNNKVKSFFYRITGGLNTRIKKLAADVTYDNSQDPQYGKQNEMIADKFATINGYAIELHTAMEKMDTIHPVRDFVEKIPILGPLMNLSTEKANADFFKYDEHPQAMQRIQTSISALEFELKKNNLDPKVKKVLKTQIEQLKELMEKASTVTDDMTKADEFIANYNKKIIKKYKYAIDKEIEDEIDKMIDSFGSK